MTTPAVSLGRYGRVDPGPSYGITTPFTTDDTLTSAQSGVVANNNGASATVTLTAPAVPTLGDNYTLHRMSAYSYPLRFQPGAGHLVEGETVDKYVELQSAGVMMFEYTRTGVWTIVGYTCDWNPEP